MARWVRRIPQLSGPFLLHPTRVLLRWPASVRESISYVLRIRRPTIRPHDHDPGQFLLDCVFWGSSAAFLTRARVLRPVVFRGLPTHASSSIVPY